MHCGSACQPLGSLHGSPPPPRERWLLGENKSVAHAVADAVAAEYERGDEPVRSADTALRATALALSQWLGPDGCSALLERALERAAQQHRSLRNIRIVANSAPALTGVAECVAAEGHDPVAAGLKATLVELFNLLVRMVGEDVTVRLARQITAREVSGMQDEEGMVDDSGP